MQHSRTMALRVVIIFRMTATIMTLGFLLVAARRLWKFAGNEMRAFPAGVDGIENHRRRRPFRVRVFASSVIWATR